jgi:hypothetical protein
MKSVRWAGYVARMGEMRNARNTLVGKPEGKRPFGRPSRRWENNIRIDLWEMGWEIVDWMHLAQWRLVVKTVINLRVSRWKQNTS